MIRALATGAALAALAAALPAQAQQAAYKGDSMGVGAGKCATYKMDLNITVEGTRVKGQFKQQGRPQRHFEATLGAGGTFKTKAEVANGSMDVSGTITESEARVLLDGYCKFETKLTRK